MEKISIQNFAGIKEMDFEFKSINILIGPQGSGKSVTVKLHYFFRSFFRELTDGITVEDSKRVIDSNQKEKFIQFFPRNTWPEAKFKITYHFNDIQMSIERSGNQIKFDYSENLKKAIVKIRKEFQEFVRINETFRMHATRRFSLWRSKVRELIETEIGQEYLVNQYFIPAGRSFFANIQKNIFSILSDNNRALDPFIVEFGANYENLKGYYHEGPVLRKDRAIDEIITEILNGDYITEKEEDYLLHKDKRKVHLSNASSGQQETLPLVVLLRVLSFDIDVVNSTIIYIEEPEAHLFPNAQNAIVRLLARIFNTDGLNFKVFVTTHSPYLLSSFNNLLEAGRLNELRPEKVKSIAKIVPKEEQLAPGLLTAYSINNGKKKNLLDVDTNLITQTVLDNVSNDIAIEFGKLLDIEF